MNGVNLAIMEVVAIAILVAIVIVAARKR